MPADTKQRLLTTTILCSWPKRVWLDIERRVLAYGGPPPPKLSIFPTPHWILIY